MMLLLVATTPQRLRSPSIDWIALREMSGLVAASWI